jgi:hypothetical protein
MEDAINQIAETLDLCYKSKDEEDLKSYTEESTPHPPTLNYHLFINGEVKGPWSKQQIFSMVETGEICGDTQVHDGTGWKLTNEVLMS